MPPMVIHPLAERFGKDPAFRKTIREAVTERAIDRALDPTGMNIAHELATGLAYKGVLAITPEEYHDDIDAFVYYGTAGLIDPTIPGEVKLYRSRGWSMRASMGLTFGRAMLGFTLFMWLIDPADKREGGWSEQEWFQREVEREQLWWRKNAPWLSMPSMPSSPWYPFKHQI